MMRFFLQVFRAVVDATVETLIVISIIFRLCINIVHIFQILPFSLHLCRSVVSMRYSKPLSSIFKF